MQTDRMLLDAIRQTGRVLSRALEADVAEHGVSLGQWQILLALWETDGLTPSEISRRVGIATPTTVNAIDGMEYANLVKRVRNPLDRRKINIHLTARGRALRDVLPSCVSDLTERATRGISARDLAVTTEVLSRIRANLLPREAAYVPEAEESGVGLAAMGG